MIAWVLPLLLAPASPPTTTAPAAASAPATSPDDEAAAQARADVTTVLTDQSRAYLQARARLVAQGERGKQALFERLDGVPPPTAAERKRLFDVLAEIGGADVATRAGEELRRAVLAETREVAAAAAAEPWRPVLRDLGVHARAALGALVAERGLHLAVRALLLDDLVALTPDAALGELLVLAGRGHATLRQQFTRSL
ncbi:MAG: hypothetical protein K1X88_31825, partial [Nannocystaceae bacterium]|nr:hypothetical protein [Nannocystaceae bacterium]